MSTDLRDAFVRSARRFAGRPAVRLVCALLESRNSGRGQVVDAAMTDGVAVLMADPNDRSSWPRARLRLERLFRTRSSAEWDALLRDHDVCVAPVRTIADAAEHPHNAARGVFVEAYGVRQPRPAPRLSRTDGLVDRQPPRPGQHTAEVLAEWAGLSSTKVASLSSKKAIQQA